jgi:hypothetical protein
MVMTDKNNLSVKESTVQERSDALVAMGAEIEAVLNKYDQVSVLEKLGLFETLKWVMIKGA